MGSISIPLDEQVDVVIVGGGPTGLLSAVLLRSLGVSVSVIDNKPGPLPLGRADALNARTQQYLEVTGILDDLRALGATCNTSSTFSNGAFVTRQDHWWTGIEHCLHKEFLMIGQPVIERTLLGRLGGANVSYGEEATSIVEDEEGITVTTNFNRTVRAKYAVGADGAKSTIRKCAGIGFTGTKPEMVWAVLDTFLDTDFPMCPEIITFELGQQSRVSWIPRERGLSRFYVLLEGEVTKKNAEESIREHLKPHRVDFLATEWFSTFEIKERIATTFVSREGEGRLLMAGDAAHVHSVNGGQGLNTGLADAFALAWRVASAVHGSKNAKAIIKSYDTERRAVCRDVIDVAARLVRLTLNSAKEYVGMIERSHNFVTGMGVAYDGTGSALLQESEQGIWKAGKRCPDIKLFTHGSSEPRWLYSTVKYGQFLILSIGGQLEDDQYEPKESFSRYTLLPLNHGTNDATLNQKGDVLVAEAEEIKPDERFTVIVRPDMYIGYVGTEKKALEFLSDIV